VKTKITPRIRGPLVVEGEVELVDLRGNPVDVSGRQRLMLCRCGVSKSKPFCDGSHHRVAFEVADAEDRGET
jgi:CDGSH-type Zn-finger protein